MNGEYTRLVEDTLSEGKQDYVINHNSYSSAIDHALKWIEKQGYQVEEDEVWNQISTNSKKPSRGKTTRVDLALTKNGKPQKKGFHIQVYGKDNDQYELNMYVL